MAASRHSISVALVGITVLGVLGSLQAGCSRMHGALIDAIEARRVAGDLRVQFAKATEAGSRAVMADTDEASLGAAHEAREATEAAVRDADALRPLLRALHYTDEQRFLDAFIRHFAEYRRLDVQILPMAVENTNLKAQRLLFGPAREASDEFRAAVDAAARTARPQEARAAEALAARAAAAVLEVQVLLAPHIATADDAVMTRLEAQGARAEQTARTSTGRLGSLMPSDRSRNVDAARAALDRFAGVCARIVALSRRNTNVRSLALSLGRKRVVTVQCDEQLRALEAALRTHEFTATR